MKYFSREVMAASRRLNYYGKGVLRELTPGAVYRRLRLEIFSQIHHDRDVQLLAERVNYYNKLDYGSHALPQTSLRAIDRSKSRYFFDLAEYLKYFSPKLSVDYLWGDITEVPDRPKILKSRPIGTNNDNSVLFNLDKFRHFQLADDRISWTSKLPKAIWRGSLNNQRRIDLVRAHHKSSFCDVGQIGTPVDGIAPKGFLPPSEQLRYRYIVSVEGVDVATNLKWIMASSSICLMPRPRYETWFMEGRLKPDHHFVLLKDDFSDLEEKIDMLESNPAMARDINNNARSYVREFVNPLVNREVSLLVLQKYFEATGQLPTSDFTPYFLGSIVK